MFKNKESHSMRPFEMMSNLELDKPLLIKQDTDLACHSE